MIALEGRSWVLAASWQWGGCLQCPFTLQGGSGSGISLCTVTLYGASVQYRCHVSLLSSVVLEHAGAGYCFVGKIPTPGGGGVGMGGWVGPEFQHFEPPAPPPPLPMGVRVRFLGVLGLCRALRSA